MAIRVILLDIEGTTSSISFVHDVLFPYAAEKLPDFVRANATDDTVRQLLRDAAAEAGQPDADDEAVIAILLQWIRDDRKATPLKALQGLIWKAGYENGDFTAHVYEDAHRRMKEWHAAGKTLAVYSSGSIKAQQLFFGYCDYGDLTPLFAAHFDTTTGPKKEAASYETIRQALDVPADGILFLSDVIAELDAAAAAGMQTTLLVRDESQPLEGGAHRAVRSFDDIPVE